jgi:hypothetical protein
MAIIAVGSPDKGQSNDITLTRSELVTKVTNLGADAYFQDPNNWKSVVLTYRTDSGNQVNDVVFDGQLGAPIGDFNPSADARDLWIVQSISIVDFDNGSYRIEKSDLTEPEFADIDFGVQPIGDLITNTSPADTANLIGFTLGQTFEYVSNFNLSDVILQIRKATGSPTGNAVVSVYESKAKSVLYGTSDSLDVSTLSASYQDSTFTFSTPISGLLANTSYYFELDLSGVTQDGSNFLQTLISFTSTYPDGNLVTNGTDGSEDFNFVIRGN